ncbi:MAG: hypothetical protein VX939_00780 [Pseudomonadota bacterium]|nr:hypothetical protein [Pseudomonadota bacterium]
MRADLSSRCLPSGRLAAIFLLALSGAGCKTEKDPDQPTLIGSPPDTAYLGVEYYYNWGAYGGEGILDYSLTNAPAWLALEDTSNKARQGVIMRGVPGLSGGNRGDADVGNNDNIDIISTDGRMAGFQPFDIQVKRNLVTAEVPDITEGERPVLAEPTDRNCRLPDLEPRGQHEYTIDLYDETGARTGQSTVVSETRRAYARLQLEQPSVTRVAIAFELQSDFDPLECDEGFSDGHQRCTYGTRNNGRAIIGQDFVALGSDSDAPFDRRGVALDYIQYQQNADGIYDRGVVTLEPGIVECYIPFEVVDDRIPEPSELASVELTEIRNGLASLGNDNSGVTANLTIADDEPVVTLETQAGGQRDSLNVESSRSYVARLSGEREGEVRLRLADVQGASASLGNQYSADTDELVFPEGVDEVTFSVTANPYVNAADETDDLFGQLGSDNAYQNGREGYVRTAADTLLRLNLNRLDGVLAFGNFVPTDLVLGQGGRLFVAGYDPDNSNQVQIRVFDQEGVQMGAPVEITGAGASLAPSQVFVDVAERQVTVDTSRVTRYDVAVAFTTDNGAIGANAKGGEDVVVGLYRYNGTTEVYEPLWPDLYRLGTSGDDVARWVGLNPGTGFVAVAGETTGTWPNQTRSGGVDAFLARIDSTTDAANLVPTLAWARQAGSGGNDQVVGGSIDAISPLLFAQAAGSVDGTASTGPFYFSGSASADLSLTQIGTDASETLRDGFYAGGNQWLIGDAQVTYATKESEDGNEQLSLARTVSDSRAGFSLGYGSSAVIRQANSYNDQNDGANDRMNTGVWFDGSVVVAGSTDGEFQNGINAPAGGAAVLARGTGNPDDGPFGNWRTQLAEAGSSVVGLENYRDDELVALIEEASGRYVLLLNAEGRLLNLAP